MLYMLFYHRLYIEQLYVSHLKPFSQVEGKHDEACIAMLNNFYADGAVCFIDMIIIIIKASSKTISFKLLYHLKIKSHPPLVQVWHDIACYHKKWFVCEDSDKLMDFAKQTSPEHAPRI